MKRRQVEEEFLLVPPKRFNNTKLKLRTKRKPDLSKLFQSLNVTNHEKRHKAVITERDIVTTAKLEPKEQKFEDPSTILAFMIQKNKDPIVIQKEEQKQEDNKFTIKSFQFRNLMRNLQYFLLTSTRELLGKLDYNWDQWARPIVEHIDLDIGCVDIKNKENLKKWAFDLQLAASAAGALKEEAAIWETELNSQYEMVNDILLALDNKQNAKHADYFN